MADIAWTGAADDNWDQTTVNWETSLGAVATDFNDGDNVTFGLSAENSTITITENVAPAAIINGVGGVTLASSGGVLTLPSSFSTNSRDLTISAETAGTANTVVDGTDGVVTFSGTNSYSGTLTLSPRNHTVNITSNWFGPVEAQGSFLGAGALNLSAALNESLTLVGGHATIQNGGSVTGLTTITGSNFSTLNIDAGGSVADLTLNLGRVNAVEGAITGLFTLNSIRTVTINGSLGTLANAANASLAADTQDNTIVTGAASTTFGTIGLNEGNDALTIDGTHTGNIFATIGEDTLDVGGTLTGDLRGGEDADDIDITGTVNGRVAGGADGDSIDVGDGTTQGDVNGRIVGNAGDDTISAANAADAQRLIGNAGADDLTGSAFADFLSGGAAGDALSGGDGNDILLGGAGSDTLTGGGGNDIFRFRDVSDSPTGGGDEIADFVQGSDLIDLRRIDAVSGGATNEAFTFIGTNAFSGTAGELRVNTLHFVTTEVEADVDGDGTADFEILLTNGTINLVAADFLL